jgi:hypothetical protein
MKIKNENILEIDGAAVVPDLSVSFNLKPIWLGHVALASIQLVFSGSSPTGTFKLQASCDPGQPNAQSEAQQYSGVSNWTDISSSSQAVTTSGNVIWNIADPGYQWVRVAWTATSGTGTVTKARSVTKGI